MTPLGRSAGPLLGTMLQTGDERLRIAALRRIIVLARPEDLPIIVGALRNLEGDDLPSALKAIGAISTESPKAITEATVHAVRDVSFNGPNRGLRWEADELANRLELQKLEAASRQAPSQAAVAPPASASAPPPLSTGPLVAVFDLVDGTSKLRLDEIETLSAAAGSGMSASGKFRLVARDDLREAMKGDKKRSGPCNNLECRRDVSRAVRASKFLSIKLAAKGADCSLSVALYDAESDDPEKAVSDKCPCDASGARSTLTQLVNKIASP
jgi:hypothetical protein